GGVYLYQYNINRTRWVKKAGIAERTLINAYAVDYDHH
ncbi:Rhs family protein, partial [Pseudomonas congelans]